MDQDINQIPKSPNECQELPPVPITPNLDKAPGYCEEQKPNLRKPNDPTENWFEDTTWKKSGFGSRIDCDPMTAGKIINDLKDPVKTTIYRYSKSIEGTDEAVQDMFKDIVVVDENGKHHIVPIIWGSQERAVTAILQTNVRKDETLVIDRIRLPMMAIMSNGMEFDERRYTHHKALNYMRGLRKDNKPGFTVSERYDRDTVFGVARGLPVNVNYTLWVWTLHLQDMNYIIEQIIPRIAPMGQIRVKGINWDIPLKLTSIGNNINPEIGENQRIIKYEFSMVAETYIAQPIQRQKAVLKTKVEIANSVNEDEITDVYAKLENAVKDLEC